MDPLQGPDYEEMQARLRAALAQKAGLAPDPSAAPPVADAAPPSSGSAPAAPQVGTDDAALAALRDAQQRDWDRTNRNELMEAGRQILAGAARTPYQSHPTETDAAQRMVKEYLQAKMQMQHGALDARLKEAQAKQAEAHARYWDKGGHVGAGSVVVNAGNRAGVIRVLSGLDKDTDWQSMSNEDLALAYQGKAQVAAAAAQRAKADAASGGGAHSRIVPGGDGQYHIIQSNGQTTPTGIKVPPKGAGGGGHGGGGSSDDAKQIAQAIIEGRQPPDMVGLRNATAPVRAELARNGFDLTTAERDWKAITRHLATLNGPQQERLRQAVTFTYDSLDNIEKLYEDWKRVGSVSGIKLFNKGSLATAKQFPGEAGATAQALEAQINDLTSELGTVYKGGNASTDETLRLAAENLRADWNEPTFKKALGLIRKNLQIRKNSILTSRPVGVSDGSKYAPPATADSSPAPVSGPPTIKSKAERDALPPGTQYKRPGDDTIYTRN